MGDITRAMLVAGWSGMLAGAVSGAAIGLFFHEERWLGGYGSFSRRLLRLGHISFFGLGFLNLLFALSLHASGDETGTWTAVAAGGLLLGSVSMPTCCFLTVWKRPFRHLFFVPVLSVLVGVVATLVGLAQRGA